MKKWLKRKIQNLFWNWDLMGAIVRKAQDDSRKDMIYWLTNRISIEDTIKFLKQEKDNGKKYWNLACFIDKNLNNPTQ
jgi:hypothetical protein